VVNSRKGTVAASKRKNAVTKKNAATQEGALCENVIIRDVKRSLIFFVLRFNYSYSNSNTGNPIFVYKDAKGVNSR